MTGGPNPTGAIGLLAPTPSGPALFSGPEHESWPHRETHIWKCTVEKGQTNVTTGIFFVKIVGISFIVIQRVSTSYTVLCQATSPKWCFWWTKMNDVFNVDSTSFFQLSQDYRISTCFRYFINKVQSFRETKSTLLFCKLTFWRKWKKFTAILCHKAYFSLSRTCPTSPAADFPHGYSRIPVTESFHGSTQERHSQLLQKEVIIF